MSDLSNQAKEQIKKEIEMTRTVNGISLKEMIAAGRKASREFEEKLKKSEEELGIGNLIASNGRILVERNAESYTEIREGYGMEIPDTLYTKILYDAYRISDNGTIECISNNIDANHEPKAKEGDLEEINKYINELTKLAEEHKKISKKTRINLPGTKLSVVIVRESISLAHNLRPDSEGYRLIDDGADFWILAEPKYESISVPQGRGFVENMSELLEEVHVPEEEIPEYIMENLGEKISVFPKKNRFAPGSESYKMTDYSKTKERLYNIVRGVKNKKLTKEKEEIKDEQEFTND